MEVQGKVKLVKATETVGNNGFRKRDIIITTDEQYPQHLSIQFVQDKCDLLNNFQPGQDVKIGINLRGREWVNPQGETKYFNSIQGWRIEFVQADSTTSPSDDMGANAPSSPTTAFEPVDNLEEDGSDDLPF